MRLIERNGESLLPLARSCGSIRSLKRERAMGRRLHHRAGRNESGTPTPAIAHAKTTVGIGARSSGERDNFHPQILNRHSRHRSHLNQGLFFPDGPRRCSPLRLAGAGLDHRCRLPSPLRGGGRILFWFVPQGTNRARAVCAGKLLSGRYRAPDYRSAVRVLDLEPIRD